MKPLPLARNRGRSASRITLHMYFRSEFNVYTLRNFEFGQRERRSSICAESWPRFVLTKPSKAQSVLLPTCFGSSPSLFPGCKQLRVYRNVNTYLLYYVFTSKYSYFQFNLFCWFLISEHVTWARLEVNVIESCIDSLPSVSSRTSCHKHGRLVCRALGLCAPPPQF